MNPTPYYPAQRKGRTLAKVPTSPIEDVSCGVSEAQFRQEASMVGDRQRIDGEVADELVTRLHAAGIELHRALALRLSEEAQNRIKSAIEEIQGAINIVRAAAIDLDPHSESDSAS
jgi:signal transduction histidine kinase